MSQTVWEWPSSWAVRLAGWTEGAVFRVDRRGSLASPAERPLGSGERLLPERPVLGHPALIAADRSGRLIAFSDRAVNQALAVARTWRIGWLYSSHWHVAWLNGALAEGDRGYMSNRAIPGFDVMDVGESCLLYCPEVLGPLGRIVGAGLDWENGRFEVSPGTAVRVVEAGILVRSAALADGWWRHGRIEPWSAEGGWLFIRTNWPLLKGVE